MVTFQTVVEMKDHQTTCLMIKRLTVAKPQGVAGPTGIITVKMKSRGRGKSKPGSHDLTLNDEEINTLL